MATPTNNETIVEAIKVILTALAEIAKLIFNSKATQVANETEKAKHTEIVKPSVGYIDPVEFSWHFGKLPVEEQMQIREIINENYEAGVTEYTFKTKSSKVFRVVNGGQIFESTEGYTK